LPDDKGKPEPLGKITVLFKGSPVMDVPARGGPWKSYKDKRNPGHTADPTAAGTFTLAGGSAVVTSAWPYSQLANGTPIRDTGTDVEFLRNGKWISVAKLAKPLDRDSIMQISARVELQRQVFSGTVAYADVKKKWDTMKASNDFTPLAPTWQLNDFGKEGFRILGTPGDIVHTTPETDDEARIALDTGKPELFARLRPPARPGPAKAHRERLPARGRPDQDPPVQPGQALPLGRPERVTVCSAVPNQIPAAGSASARVDTIGIEYDVFTGHRLCSLPIAAGWGRRT
jgi:hypothetical protein